MKYLIVQDWRSTHGNHAGMKHMCNLLEEKYPAKYEVYVKDIPKEWEKPKTFFEKIRWKLFGHNINLKSATNMGKGDFCRR